MKRIVILGAGTAGSIMANRLRRALPRQEWDITIIDRDNQHHYQPGYLFVPFGDYSPASIVRRRSSFLPGGVTFIIDWIESLDIQSKVVHLSSRDVPYDYLIVATGVHIRPDLTPGMKDPVEWHRSIFDFYSLKGCSALGGAFAAFQGGHVVIHLTDMPIKCPVSHIEFALLTDDYFRRRQLRSKVEITLVTPLEGALTKPIASELLVDYLKARRINVVSDFCIDRVDGPGKRMIAFDGREINYDLLVTIPINQGSDFLVNSGLADASGLVKIDRHTMQSTVHPDVFALGDCTNAPTSKAGSVAHFQSQALVPNFLNYIQGKPMEMSFDGHANCFIESGSGKAFLLDFNYDIEPITGRYPLGPFGPLSLLGESRANYWAKAAFYWLYWHFLVRGRSFPFPLPRLMPTWGKHWRRWGLRARDYRPRARLEQPVQPVQPVQVGQPVQPAASPASISAPSSQTSLSAQVAPVAGSSFAAAPREAASPAAPAADLAAISALFNPGCTPGTKEAGPSQPGSGPTGSGAKDASEAPKSGVAGGATPTPADLFGGGGPKLAVGPIGIQIPAEPPAKVRQAVEFNQEGFLANPADWSEELAIELAQSLGIELGEEHWEAIHFVRRDFLEQGAAPSIRRIIDEGGFDVHRLYELFPGKPAPILAYLVGAPRPTSCL